MAFVALALVLSACAAAPAVEAMQTDPRCHVWARGGLGQTVAARVEQGQATVYTGMGEREGAYFTSATEVALDGGRVATYTRPTLVVHGAMGDLDPIVIGPRGAVAHGGTGDVQFEFNERCSDRDAALAVSSLVVAIASSR